MNKKDFKPGEYVVYVNGDTYQIGRVKRLNSRGAFVFYHGGDTAASTPLDNLYKLENGYCITESIFPYEELNEYQSSLREELELCEKSIQCLSTPDKDVFDYTTGLLEKRIQELNSPQVTNYCPVCAERAKKDGE